MLSANPDKIANGGFFSLFNLPPTIFKEDVLEKLGEVMAGIETPGTGSIDSGYVYLGQFIAHDVSRLTAPGRMFVPALDLVQERTSPLDLDSVYGGEHVWARVDATTGKMKLGRAIDVETGRWTSENDLPRIPSGIALIGDDRNDENLLVAQLHLQFLKLHNYFVDHIRRDHAGLSVQELFEQARLQTILHYQEIVLFDFLETMIDRAVWRRVIASNSGSIWDPLPAEYPRIPVEFSAAAFRFGHSMVRRDYSLNSGQSALLRDLFTMTGTGGFGGLPGLPDSYIVDWRYFFSDSRWDASREFANVSLAIDPVVPIRLGDGTLLAAKNLRTGNRSLLPDAQSIVRHIERHHPTLAIESGLRLLTGRELSPDVAVRVQGSDEFKIVGLLELIGDRGFERKTPLWYYILAEALALKGGRQLGPLGSLLVAEVLRALVLLSKASILTTQDINPGYIQRTRRIDGNIYLSMSDVVHAVR
jgi:hypothetical protein